MRTRTRDMLFLIVTYICVNTVSAQYLQIEIANTTIEYGSDDLDVLCHMINGTLLNSVFTIQLQRSGSSVVSVTPGGISWQDSSLQNRDLVTANGSVSDVMAARLHVNIPASSVVYPDDEGDYQCTMAGLDLTMASVNDQTRSVFVNITGYTEPTTVVETTPVEVTSPPNTASSAPSPTSASSVPSPTSASSVPSPTTEAPSGINAGNTPNILIGAKVNVGNFILMYSAIVGLMAIKNVCLAIL